MAAPSIPPRPSRSSNMPSTTTVDLAPQVPARPRRNVERSVSPGGDRYARSPLNDPSFLHKVPSRQGGSSLTTEVPQRPPSVSLPSVGQEGLEYDHATPRPDKHEQNPLDPQTTSIAGEIPLHAPKAAAIGIGKAHSNASETDLSQQLTRSSSRQSEGRSSRPASLYKTESHVEHDEHGIPMIGLHVPMYPNAGDVQAPTPSPGLPPPSKGIGFFNNGGVPTLRNHTRTKSGRDVFQGPPGSYGLHGHGVNKTDPFEKAWYEKHPEALAREAKGEYGPAIREERGEWALTSDELNKLVHAKSLPGMGASPAAIGTPAEDIGYIASEEYAQRYSRPSSTKPRRSSSQTHAESPLRKMSFPVNEREDAIKAVKHGKSNDSSIESEAEEDVIHVDMLRSHRRFENNKPTVDLSATGGNTAEKGGFYREDGSGTPILASDESAFRPDAKYLQPAIEPEFERRSSTYLDLPDSRPHSRSNSINAISQQHLAHIQARENRPESVGTPLEDVKEYEPLFEDEDEPRAATAPAGLSSPSKKSNGRPDLARHHFPSRDIWEDVPDSLNYVTEVDSPQLEEQPHREAEHEPKDFFETPEQEAKRKETITKADQENFLPKETVQLAKHKYTPGVLGEIPTRPGMAQRFPSQDIWEDTPSSTMHTTTLDGEEEEEEETSPIVAKQPQIPARPVKKAASEESSALEPRQAPVVPGRPKPQVPARPSKLRESSDASDNAPLAKSLSKDSSQGRDAAPAVKAKPAVPSRPAGSKIAALQAGFMSDLNKKLGLGPQPAKKEEPEEAPVEKAPLADARKGRARGPQRRKPGVSPSGAGEEAAAAAPTSRPVFKFTISRPQTIWEVDEGILSVPVNAPSIETAKAISEAAASGTPAEIHLMAEYADEAKAEGNLPSKSETAPLEKMATSGDASAAVRTGKTGSEGKPEEEGTVAVAEDGKERVSGTEEADDL